jgi:cytochrome c oxidase assembly protein subunit 15
VGVAACHARPLAYNRRVRGRLSFESLALSLLVLTVGVILWGAFVRVTGSGAGCADHWPLCNGVLVPRSPRLETVIEFTHRLTSGLSGLLSLLVFFRARREFAAGTPVRRAALAGLLLMLFEGAIGAMLVKLGLVAKDSSPLRALVVGIHLGNTFLLLAAQMLTWQFARGLPALRLRERPGLAALLVLALFTLIALGATGAVTALGDTLFPSASLAAGWRDDLDPGAHFLVRLRVFHPLAAILAGAAISYLAQYLRSSVPEPEVSRWALSVMLLYVVQLGLGALNLFLLAPAPIQIAHLLLADLVWLAFVGLAASALAAPLQVSFARAAS